jgi:membrane fusion protein (multidrug efflux system)
METNVLDEKLEKEIEALKDSPQTPAPSRRKWFILGALIAVAAAAAYLWISSLGRVSTDDAQVDGHIAPVASKIYGNVVEVLVNDNQAVKAGQVLVRIDPRDYQVKVDQARAALLYARSQSHGANVGVPLTRDTTLSSTSGSRAKLSAAQADFARAEIDVRRASNADIAFARATVESAQANCDRAQADLKRMQPLVEKTEISRLQFDAYVAAARVAQGDLKAAQEKLSAAQQDAENKKAALYGAQARVQQAEADVLQSQANEKQVNVRVADAASASAGIEQAKANLEAAELQLSYTNIVAPMDGVVTRKTVEAGQIVQQGQSLLTIVPLNDVWVTANFKETQLRGVRPGQKAEVKLDLSGNTYPAHVDSIAGATGARLSLLPPENATGNFVKVVQRIPVKIMLDPLPSGGLLRPGMNVDATIILK